MGVDPLNPKTLAHSIVPPLEGAAARVPAERRAADPPPTRRTGDTIELSATSRKLVQQVDGDGDVPPSGTLAPERLRGVLRRMEDGHYERPEVIDTIARRVAAELEGA